MVLVPITGKIPLFIDMIGGTGPRRNPPLFIIKILEGKLLVDCFHVRYS